jgi:hypothetical protein
MRARLLAGAVAMAAFMAGAGHAVAAPRWKPVAQTDDSVFLLDESSIQTRAGLLTAWELVEYAWPQYSDGVTYRSQLNLRAYSCADASWDVLQITRYAESAGAGEVVLAGKFSPSNVTWNHVAPESVAEHMLREVCALAATKDLRGTTRG